MKLSKRNRRIIVMVLSAPFWLIGKLMKGVMTIFVESGAGARRYRAYDLQDPMQPVRDRILDRDK